VKTQFEHVIMNDNNKPATTSTIQTKKST